MTSAEQERRVGVRERLNGQRFSETLKDKALRCNKGGKASYRLAKCRNQETKITTRFTSRKQKTAA